MSDAAYQPPADEGSSLGDAASHFSTEPGGTPAGPAGTSTWTRLPRWSSCRVSGSGQCSARRP